MGVSQSYRSIRDIRKHLTVSKEELQRSLYSRIPIRVVEITGF